MKDKKFKINYNECMERKCDVCKYKIYCFKEEGNEWQKSGRKSSTKAKIGRL